MTVLSICAIISLSAQDKVDLYGQAQMRQYRMEQRLDKGADELNKQSQIASLNDEVVVFVALEDGVTVDQLQNDGMEVLDSRGELALVRVSKDMVQQFSRSNLVKKVEFGKKVMPHLKVARNISGVDMVHKGYGLEQTYTGAGVVTGLFDTGVDPNHLAFYNSDQTESRVKRLWRITGQNGMVSTYATADKIAGFTTDNTSSTHGTHVAGIMAGGFKGNDYYGVAPDADIAMSCGDLYDSNVILGATRILDYAKEEGKPVVINLSLGVNSGPHDGSDYFCRYLDNIGQEAIVCISAGNEGSMPIAMEKSFTDKSTEIKTFIETIESDGVYYGSIDYWSKDETAVKMTPVIYDLVADEIVYQMPTCEGNSNANWTYVSSDAYYETGDLTNEVFNEFFEGYMGYASVVVSDNNRYEVMMYYSMKNSQNNDGRYVPGLIFNGESGQQVFGYSDGAYIQFSDNGVDGWYGGTTNGTISNMACGKNVVVVGSYDSNDSFETKDGYVAGYPSLDVTEGMASVFSSYGELYDGRCLPHILAPGCIIVSSYSGPYMNYALNVGAEQEQYMAALETKNGNNYYWGAQVGTSMASPFMAGAVALWLQADSTLTVQEVHEIINETAADVQSKIDPIQCGAGKLSVYNGIKEVLDGVTKVCKIVEDPNQNMLMIPKGNNSFEVYVSGEARLSVMVADMCGRIVMNTSVDDNSVTIDTDSWSKGVYTLVVQGAKAKYCRRVLVK